VAKPYGVVDASCVIALDTVNLMPELTWLFGRLLIPKAVRTELYRRRITKDRIKALQREYAGFLVSCDDYDQTAVDVLLTGRIPPRTKDRGETEAVVQAAVVGAMVIVDDPWGRKLAEQYSLEYHGTIWVLERLQALGLLTSGRLRMHLQHLKARRIRFPVSAANALLQRLGEEML
jgi:predicted nucleic acid-binding protein